jgi:hypothetical protein
MTLVLRSFRMFAGNRPITSQFSRAALAITSMASGCRDRTLSESAPLSSQAR